MLSQHRLHLNRLAHEPGSQLPKSHFFFPKGLGDGERGHTHSLPEHDQEGRLRRRRSLTVPTTLSLASSSPDSSRILGTPHLASLDAKPRLARS